MGVRVRMWLVPLSKLKAKLEGSYVERLIGFIGT